MNFVEKAISLVIGTKSERDMKRMRPMVEAINALEPQIEKLSDDEIKARFAAIRERVTAATQDLPEDRKVRSAKVQKVLDAELTEVFALVRETGKRVLGMRHFDVQLVGGIVLHQGRIAEMRTGEGKTLVATLAASLNALTGRGVHLVTVNDYLASRDAEWMGRIYRFLGLTVGCIQNDMDDAARKAAYACDITYGTNNEFGFDYLRDNMKFQVERMVQREHVYAIVDEVDSILIDEARTPLIISGPSEISTDIYYRVDAVIPKLVRGDVQAQFLHQEPGPTQGKGRGQKPHPLRPNRQLLGVSCTETTLPGHTHLPDGKSSSVSDPDPPILQSESQLGSQSGSALSGF